MQRDPVGAGTAGAVATFAAIGVGQVVSALLGPGPGPVEAVGDRFITAFAGPLKQAATSVLGTLDKPVLLIGTVAVAVALGVWVGRLARRRFPAALAVFAGFVLLGGIASATADLGSIVPAALASLAAFITGGTLLRLLVTPAAPHPAGLPELPAEPTDGAGRRQVLAAAAAAVGVIGFAGQYAAQAARRTSAAARLLLPAPVHPLAVPTGFTDPGVTPYLVPAKDFYRIDTALVVPQVDVDSWSLQITGMVQRRLTLTFSDLLARGVDDHAVTLSCVSNEVGGDLVGNAVWRGVPLLPLLQEAGLDPAATQVFTTSVDGFTAGFPVAALQDGRTAIIAVGMNGGLLPPEHGFPARLVVSGLYGYVSATKWISEISLTTWDAAQGFWVPRGWAREAPVKLQSRVDIPTQGASVSAGRVVVAGVAWAPSVGVSGVQIRIDDGPWQPAQLGPIVAGRPDTWVQWRLPITVEAGQHSVTVRATDRHGSLQTEQSAPPAPDGATGWHTVSFSAR